MIEVKNLSFAYPGKNRLLHDISFQLKQGDFTFLLGCNGCGKSTVLRLLSGLLHPVSGYVFCDGIPLKSMPDRVRASKIAVVPQQTHFPFDYTVEELVRIGGNAGRAKEEAVEKALTLLELHALKKRSCRKISCGEFQRVLIAMALAVESEYLFLDEPTSALDPGYAAKLMTLLKSLTNQLGIFVITHDIQLTALHAQKVILLHAGGIVSSGTPRDTLTAENLRTLYDFPASVTEYCGNPVILFYNPEKISCRAQK